MTSFVGEWFRGEAPLWKPYWLGGIVAGLFSQVMLALAAPFGGAAVIVALLAAIASQVWLQVAIWRCAFNAKWSGWGYLARVGVLTWIAGWVHLAILWAALF